MYRISVQEIVTNLDIGTCPQHFWNKFVEKGEASELNFDNVHRPLFSEEVVYVI